MKNYISKLHDIETRSLRIAFKYKDKKLFLNLGKYINYCINGK